MFMTEKIVLIRELKVRPEFMRHFKTSFSFVRVFTNKFINYFVYIVKIGKHGKVAIKTLTLQSRKFAGSIPYGTTDFLY